MSTISFDGQSLIIDGKRIWLVSGSIHYPRVPRGLWRDRIRAAKQAGLNCIDTFVFWNHHESSPGVFDFTGEKDLRAFVQTIAQEGMYCILRPGPFVGSGWDFGGLPAWLLRDEPSIKLRQADPAFLSACSRYFAAVMVQVRDLQITAPHRSDISAAVAGNPGGPIVLMQVEHEWHCFNPEQEEKYLRELVRYLRENGCNVPLTNANRLWQPIEGTFTTWGGESGLLGDIRQLRSVQPWAPGVVSECVGGSANHWGSVTAEPTIEHAATADDHLHRLAQGLAAGAQSNVSLFHGGTSFGFSAGRASFQSPGQGFHTTSHDTQSPVTEAGGRGEWYGSIKRVGVFQSQFAHVLAHLNHAWPDVTTDVHESDHQLGVTHLRGSQGDLVMIRRGSQNTDESVSLLLGTGESIRVPLGTERVKWLLLNANLGGVAKLDSSNLSPWAFVDRRMLVLFGPSGASGQVTINQSTLHVTVPTANGAHVHKHEGLTLVIVSTEQLDTCYLSPEGLVIGAAGLDSMDRPIPHRSSATTTLVRKDGSSHRLSTAPIKLDTAPRLGRWDVSEVTSLLDGSSPNYKIIDGPRSHERLGHDRGYGWYKLSLPAEIKVKTLCAPQANHRVHLLVAGSRLGTLGAGPGAEESLAPAKLGKLNVALTDNLGRVDGGWHLGEQTGLFGHLYDAQEIKLDKPHAHQGQSPDPFVVSGFWAGERRGQSQHCLVYTWTFKCPATNAVLIRLIAPLSHCSMTLNGRYLGLYSTAHDGPRWVLADEASGAKVGVNTLSLFVPRDDAATLSPTKLLRLFHAKSVTEKASWAFAPFTEPGESDFSAAAKKLRPGVPRWYRTTFSVKSTPPALWLETQGLSKGQIYLNGHNVGRYFQNTADGTFVGPQLRYYLPEPWLRTDAPNELEIFDEHGNDPSKCHLVYTTESAFIKLSVKSSAKAASKPRVASSSKRLSKSRNKTRDTKKR